MAEVSTRADLIERKIDRGLADEISVSREAGGVDIRKLGQVMEAAKLMSLAGSMIPGFLRENPGGCFAIVWKAYAWGMDPFAVASMAYEVINRRTGEKTVAFMSQLTHAIIEARAPIKRRLEVRYEGEGDDRVCIVGGTLIGEDKPREHRSPRLADRKPKRRGRDSRDPRDEGGVVEDEDQGPGSPLWRSKPDVQLFYDTSRDWARIYCPDVLLGIYTKEEMAEVGYTPPAAAAPPQDDGGLAGRLSSSALARAGFPSEAAAAEVDAAMAQRDKGRTPPETSLSGGEEGDAPELPLEADSVPKTEERRPRAARSRRGGRPEDDARQWSDG